MNLRICRCTWRARLRRRFNVRDVVVALADAPVRALDGRRRRGTAWALMGFIVSFYWSSLNDGALMALICFVRQRARDGGYGLLYSGGGFGLLCEDGLGL